MAIKIFGTNITGGEAQRKEASANEFSSKYPLSNDCDVLKATINAAKAELAQINASRPSTSGGKRIKKRNYDSLKTWINESNNYLKDLTCGIVGSAVQGQAITFQPKPIIYTKDTIAKFTPPTPITQPTLPNEVVNKSQEEAKVVEAEKIVYQPTTPTPQLAMEYGSGEATPIAIPKTDNTQKYLLYGGIGLVAILVMSKLVKR